MSDLDEAAAQRLVDTVPHWHQRIHFPQGVDSPGAYDPRDLLRRLALPELRGKRVLDVGTRDGFFAFTCEHLGAEVVAIDSVPASDTGFPVARRLFGSRIEYRQANVYDLTAERFGVFDVVLFLGVLYHLRHPLLALDQLRTVCRGTLYLESLACDESLFTDFAVSQPLRSLAPALAELPIAEFLPRGRFHGDSTNKWAPNVACLRGMLEDALFENERVETWGDRALIVARPRDDGVALGDRTGSHQGIGVSHRLPASPLDAAWPLRQPASITGGRKVQCGDDLSVKRARRDDPAAAGLPQPHWRRAAAGALLWTLCLAIYLVNGRTVPFARGGDTLPSRLIPFSILEAHTLTLDPFAAQLDPSRWYLRKSGEHLLSAYPIGTGVVATIGYLPAWAIAHLAGHADRAALFAASEKLEKEVAAALAATAVLFVFLTARRSLSMQASLWIALGFGVATSVWATASAMLWQHGPVILGLSVALFVLTSPGRTLWTAAVAGGALGSAFLARPTAALFLLAGALAIAAAAARGDRPWKSIGCYVGGAFPWLTAAIAYDVHYFGRPLGAWGQHAGGLSAAHALAGTAGLLVSPNRGLFVFSPVVLVGVYGIARALRRPVNDGGRMLSTFAAAAIAHLVVAGSYFEWAGGWSFGPRYLVDILPILALGAIYAWPALTKSAKAALAIAFAWSVAVQLDGSFCYPASGWDARMTANGLEREAWGWQHFELLEDFLAWRRSVRAVAQF